MRTAHATFAGLRSGLLLTAQIVALLLPASTLAQEPTRLLVLAERADLVSARLAAELSALGFSVQVSAPPSDPDSSLEHLQSLRAEQRASALIWLQAKERGFGALIFAAEGGPTETLALPRAPGVRDAIWAIQLVERLRPALLNLPATAAAVERPGAARAPATTQPRPASEPASPLAVAQPHARLDEELSHGPGAPAEREPSARFTTELGLGMLGAHGMSPVSTLSATLGMLVLPPALRLELVTLVPLQRMERESKTAKTLAHVTFVGLDLRLDLLRARSFQLSLALGGALSVLRAQSRATGQPNSIDKISGSACGYLRLGSSYQLTRVIALRGEAIVGSFIETLLVHVERSAPLAWGRPWFAGFFAVEIAFH